MSKPMDNAVEIMRKGGTLLSEKCPRCGGVQVKYKGRVLCIAEDDLSENLQATTVSNDATLSNLRNVIIEKIDVTSNAIEKENDVAKQAVLVDLLQKYVALLKECEEENESDTNSEES